jgi:hypothetical protein
VGRRPHLLDPGGAGQGVLPGGIRFVGRFRVVGLIRAPASSSKAAWESAEAPATPVLLLEGRAGTEARAMVMISNDLDREAEAAVVASPLRGPDGRFLAADLRTEPTAVKLAPGARTSVTLVVGVTDAMEVGADYRGEINVPGLSPRGVPVVVRRLP